VFNFKWSIFAAGFGLILSLVTGLLSGSPFSVVFVRALIFAAVFFGLGSGAWFAINHFLPELLFSGSGGSGGAGLSDGSPGSRINITLEDRKLPDVFRKLENGDDVGDIGDLMSGKIKPQENPEQIPVLQSAEPGVDQTTEDSYTDDSSQTGSPPASSSDGMPDFDAMAGSFESKANDEPEELFDSPAPARTPTGNKSQSLEGDFKPQELAQGIRTILSGDK